MSLDLARLGELQQIEKDIKEFSKKHPSILKKLNHATDRQATKTAESALAVVSAGEQTTAERLFRELFATRKVSDPVWMATRNPITAYTKRKVASVEGHPELYQMFPLLANIAGDIMGIYAAFKAFQRRKTKITADTITRETKNLTDLEKLILGLAGGKLTTKRKKKTASATVRG